MAQPVKYPVTDGRRAEINVHGTRYRVSVVDGFYIVPDSFPEEIKQAAKEQLGPKGETDGSKAKGRSKNKAKTKPTEGDQGGAIPSPP